ncbi:acyltransferase, partial [Shewanella sp. SG44-6]|uniref:acyltransferase family protein n=1 Tax=Shewanella sp. SG44-6 TaxID=2760959 RepID=UPI001C71D5A8
PIYKIFILKYLPFFLAGICFYKLINEKRTYLLYFYLLFSLFSTLAIYSFRYFLIFTFFYLAFYFALIGYVKFLSIRPFIFLGSISYSLYLIHQNIGYIIINKFYELNLNPLLGISIAIVVSLILATLLSRLVEIPTMKFIREKYKINKKGQKLSKLLTFLKRS